ncbi:MAG: HAD family hydrolase [Candidatus Omnitrophota bacterium]
MERSIKLVIFDLDGTLVDAFKAVSQSVNHALSYMGYETVSQDVIERNVGWGERVLISRFVREGDLDKTLSVFRQHHRFAIKTGVKFLPGAKELVGVLKEKGYLTAIASNRPTRFTHMILKQLNFKDQFDYILCGDKVENPKPAGDMLVQILQKFSLAADQALYVGDMVIDIQAGNDARVRTVGVTTGSHTYEDMVSHNPLAIIGNVKDVAKILANGDLSLKK